MHKFLLGIAAALLFSALVMRNADLMWMALPLLVYVGIGWYRALSAGEIRLRASRAAEKQSIDGNPVVEVRINITNEGSRLIRLSISDALQPGMAIVSGKLAQSAVLQPGEDAEFKYSFKAERGAFSWKTVHVVVSDSFGLSQTELDLPAEAAIHIYPELERYRPFPLRPQRTLHSPGSIPARRGGSGTDFWGVREYHPGDPLRRLDWRLTARHPGEFFTQEFEQEEIAEIGLILDARRRTDLHVGEEGLFEHSLAATASLAEAFLRQGNRVSLLVFQQHMTSVFAGYGKVQLNRILRTLTQVRPEEDENRTGLLLTPLQMFSHRSMVIVISPLAHEDWRLFPRLRAYGYQVLVISPDPLDFARPILPTDHTAGLAIRLTRFERQMEIAHIKQLWVPVIDWQVSQPLAPLVRNALMHAHIQQQR